MEHVQLSHDHTEPSVLLAVQSLATKLSLILIVLLVGVTFQDAAEQRACAQNSAHFERTQIRWLSPLDFERKLKNTTSMQLFDLRTQDETQGIMIKDAQLKPFVRSKFSFSNAESSAIDTNKPLFLYCQDGNRTRQAAAVLSKQGYRTIWALRGGFDAWTKSGLPVVDQFKDFWDEQFSRKQYFIGTTPDEFLSMQLRKLKPGRILFPGEGEGRNAVYAAKQGWRTDAFDFSVHARLKALALAKKNHTSLKYWLADFRDFKAAPDTYDAVAIIDLPVLPAVRSAGFAKVRNCIKPGGVLLYEGYSPDSSPGNTMWPSKAELQQAFAGFKLVMLDQCYAIRHHEGKDHRDLVVRMVAIKSSAVMSKRSAR